MKNFHQNSRFFQVPSFYHYKSACQPIYFMIFVLIQVFEGYLPNVT